MELSSTEAVRLLSLSEKTLYQWIDKGSIPFSKASGQYRFNRVEILEWAIANKISISPEIFAKSENAAKVKLPSLSDTLKMGGIFYGLEGKDKQSALQSIVKVVSLPDSFDRDFFYKVLLAREELGSSAFGDGIIIPHVQNPLVLNIPESALYLCFFNQAIDSGALNGHPVKVFFCLISPTTHAHLHMVSMLAFALSDPSFKEVIKRQGSRTEILNKVRQIESSLTLLANNWRR